MLFSFVFFDVKISLHVTKSKGMQGKHCGDMLLSHSIQNWEKSQHFPSHSGRRARPRLRHGYKECGGQVGGPRGDRLEGRCVVHLSGQQVVSWLPKNPVCLRQVQGDAMMNESRDVQVFREIVVSHLKVGLLFRLPHSPFNLRGNHVLL